MVKKAILWFANAELIEAIYSDRVVWLGPLWYGGADGECGRRYCWYGGCSRKQKSRMIPQIRGTRFPLIWGVDHRRCRGGFTRPRMFSVNPRHLLLSIRHGIFCTHPRSQLRRSKCVLSDAVWPKRWRRRKQSSYLWLAEFPVDSFYVLTITKMT